jgi:hypothetical protein
MMRLRFDRKKEAPATGKVTGASWRVRNWGRGVSQPQPLNSRQHGLNFGELTGISADMGICLHTSGPSAAALVAG